MTIFLDGPAVLVNLSLARSPVFLRVVQNAAGEFDALDQLDDVAADDEQIVAYRLAGVPSVAFIDYTSKGRRYGKQVRMAKYRVVAEQPDDTTMRDTAAWRDWCVVQQAKGK